MRGFLLFLFGIVDFFVILCNMINRTAAGGTALTSTGGTGYQQSENKFGS